MPDKPHPPVFPAAASSPRPPASPNDPRPVASEPGASAPPLARSGFNRNSDVRDAMAEMAERAQLISQEAGTKIAAAMRDVIGAAAGMAGFAVESARDLVQYMVRRGQMTQDEADRLIKEAEAAQGRRSGGRDTARRDAASRAEGARASSASSRKVVAAPARVSAKSAAPAPAPASATAPAATKRPAASHSAPRAANKPAAKRAPSEKKPAAKKAPTKKRR